MKDPIFYLHNPLLKMMTCCYQGGEDERVKPEC
ncbi:hypothetical protein J2Z66_000296 [Paenibacillus eucommiae]|uniref:Uncharacterized protein n=1 Tax=Paenibacillus eucommiae TaxID=1355755 RepID=A0ABS4IMA6_9BACL|nr:hypothetical protein [Paenibacillus eucommiae]